MVYEVNINETADKNQIATLYTKYAYQSNEN